MAGAPNVTGPDSRVESTQVDDGPSVLAAPGLPQSFGGVPPTSFFSSNLAPQQPSSDFMSDLDARGDKAQAKIREAAGNQARDDSYIGSQLRDDTARHQKDLEESWNYERAAAGDPALRPWNADDERAKRVRGPMEQFGSVGFIFAMAASAFTRSPMTSALNAGAAAMTAIREGDEKSYKSAYEAWKDNSNLALKRFDMEHRLYEDANQLLTTDMNLWKTKTAMIAAQFNDQTTLAMLNEGLYPQVVEMKEKLAESAIKVRKAQEGFQEFDGVTSLWTDSFKAWKEENPKASQLEQYQAKMQFIDEAKKAYKGTLNQKLTPAQEFSQRWWQENPNGTAEEFGVAFGKFMQSQKLPGAASGRVTASGDQVQRIQERMDRYISEGMSKEQAHNRAAHEIQEEDTRAKTQGKNELDQALVNVLEKYPGMERKDLGTILKPRQPKVIAAVIESPENLEAIAKFTKENPSALGLIAEASKRVNLDAYQGLFSSWSKDSKTAQPQLEAKIAADRDAAIDKIAQERKLDLTQAAQAKVLQKMLTTQAFTDAALAGSKGATIYLDKAFREIYDPNASPGAFFSVLEKRYDEADRVAREYKLGFNDRSPESLAEMPFWTGKAAGYAGTLVDKRPTPEAKEFQGKWYIPSKEGEPGAFRDKKSGGWWKIYGG